MTNRIITSLLALVCLCIGAEAQELQVVDIRPVESSVKARTAQVRDNNGELCALLEVAAPSLEGVVFDQNKVVGEVNYSAGVYSVFVPAETKKLGFRHHDYLPGTIDFDAAGIKVEGGSTYFVSLQKPSASGTEYQFLVINVTPSSALVEVDGQPQNVSGGTVQMLLPVGSLHSYRVSANGMLPEEGKVVIDSYDEKKVVNVSLRSNTSRVHITSVPDARIAVNGSAFGTGEWTGELTPGTYRVEAFRGETLISSEVHEIVLSGDVTDIKPDILYGTVTITSSEPNASVSLDGTPVGTTPIIVRRVIPGQHTITVSKEGFKPVTMELSLDTSGSADVEVPLITGHSEPAAKIRQPEKPVQPKVKEEPKVKKERVKPEPMIFALAEAEYGFYNEYSYNDIYYNEALYLYGFSIGWVKRFGGYVKCHSTLNYVKPEHQSDSDVWLQDRKRNVDTQLIAGGMVRISKHFYPYLGAGYESYHKYGEIYSQDSSSGWADIDGVPSVILDTGILMRFGKIVTSLGCNIGWGLGFDLGIGIAF